MAFKSKVREGTLPSGAKYKVEQGRSPSGRHSVASQATKRTSSGIKQVNRFKIGLDKVPSKSSETETVRKTGKLKRKGDTFPRPYESIAYKKGGKTTSQHTVIGTGATKSDPVVRKDAYANDKGKMLKKNTERTINGARYKKPSKKK